MSINWVPSVCQALIELQKIELDPADKVLSQSVWAALAKCHSLGGIETTEIEFSQLWSR